MEGLFEVYLITAIEFQTQLFGYITDFRNPKAIRPRPCCAYSLYGDCPVQPMFKFRIYGSYEYVKGIVDEIEKNMNEKGIMILRTRIKVMADNESIHYESVAQKTNRNYFEFHFKLDIKNTLEWNKIVTILTPFGGHLFFNPYNRVMTPIATIRRYTNLNELQEVYLDAVKSLNQNGFKPFELEKEYSVYDSNVFMDKNWLFEDKPDNFIKEINPSMLFAF